MQSQKRLSLFSRIILFIAAIMLGATIFLPIWQIELYAPQYPEGLELLIYADSLAGDVEIINGLNHYIGMQTLHSENFIEFSILKYIFGFFVLFFLAVAIIGRKKPAYVLLGFFILFGIISMVDFYRWNYNYGHNLDPHAAIKVPGMAYQPPLIGYKQLLNFGAYSIPDTGGLLFIGSGLLLLFVVLKETNAFSRWFKRKKTVSAIFILTGLLSLSSCSAQGPKPIRLNKDACAYCKMTITDAQFAAQLITPKNRHYLFDDITCMLSYQNENEEATNSQFYIADFCRPSAFVDAKAALYLESDSLRSPMGGNTAAFAEPDSMMHYLSKFKGTETNWNKLMQQQ
jgi:copper chaperone NosL